ncbi:histidine kinase-like protein [Solirubrobacter pauli]|uniref:Histidine kinase-like protein n=1 Tax=Solirubrobacter pauli TaxID=166793 RepID=A0A660KWG1_9ACTN|nr:ATP-binding protein [Solirubrobacter pauli]RKQ86047.1 histidine kinase-like protein [Solirubrobacter pauli]
MRNDERAVLAVRKAARGFEPTEDAELLTTCRRQAVLIDALMRAVGDLRSGASALKAENADLRAERRRGHRGEAEAAVADAPPSGTRVEAQVRLGVHAPAMARRIIADALRDRVPSSVIDNALLTISELVTNSVCHGLSADGGSAIVRLHLTDESLLLEVEDPGQGGPVLRGRPNARTGAGYGLHVVGTISERWGSERRANGAMRVWAELNVTPSVDEALPAPQPREELHVAPAAPRTGTWQVYLGTKDAVLSSHGSETDAERAAHQHAALHECRRIVVHDRYFRTRSLTVRARSNTDGDRPMSSDSIAGGGA